MTASVSPALFPLRVYRINTLLQASRDTFYEYRQAIAEGRRRDAQIAEQRWLLLRAEADRVSGGCA